MKTAEELKITVEEYKALDKVKINLLTGRYRHELVDESSEIHDEFNMSIGCITNACGTVACIGGWTAFEMGMNCRDKRSDYVTYILSDPEDIPFYSIGHSRSLQELFYPGDGTGLEDRLAAEEHPIMDAASGFYSQITPKMAAQAIQNFQDHGDSMWYDVVMKTEA